MTVNVVILAAGMGSRLGRSLPKPLTELSDGRTIMQQQHDNIRAAFGADATITTVVGYKLEHIVEAFPEVEYVYNEAYDQTNTSKSLLRALNKVSNPWRRNRDNPTTAVSSTRPMVGRAPICCPTVINNHISRMGITINSNNRYLKSSYLYT